ncbi:MAG: lytic transglycosylase domain-containing protein [Bacteroidota bacterium]|nr:lytic transglycosylase domain-containing protein [Bacteroidota bacterium]
MKKNSFYFATFFILILTYQFLVSSSSLKSEDQNYQEEFYDKYAIFSIVKPENIHFANETIPLNNSKTWERLDKELLKNTYWQSNTLLYIKRANKYFPIIEPILKENSIPEDFKYLAVIESGLEDVVSPSGATGFWQIMKSTGKEYGLEINNEIDQRYNLEKATELACTYLNDAYDKFGSWTMSAAAYNMGINGAAKTIESQGSNNYYNLHLNNETSRYIFRILAIKTILESPKQYGFIIREKDLYDPVKKKNIVLNKSNIDLIKYAKDLGVNYKILREYNPWIRSETITNITSQNYTIVIPETEEIIFSEYVKK